MVFAEYKDGVVTYREATEEEEARYNAEQKEREQHHEKTAEERIAELEAQNEMLTECILEIADIIYA